MVLINHHAIEATSYDIDLFINIAVVEPRPHVRVIHPVADAQIQALRPHHACLVVLPWLLGKVSNEHDCPPFCADHRPRACEEVSDQPEELLSRLRLGVWSPAAVVVIVDLAFSRTFRGAMPAPLCLDSGGQTAPWSARPGN